MAPALALLLSTVPALAAPDYFPIIEARLSCSGAVNARASKWYSKHLAAANEPSLYARSREAAAAPALRFTWLRSFDPPVIIRVEWTGASGGKLVARQLSGQGGVDPGTIALSIERDLKPDEAARLKAMIAGTAVFSSTRDCGFGIDGAQWIVESIGARGYRLRVDWSPDTGPVRDLGLAMIALTGWSYQHVY